jgi:beta-lactamase class A
MRKILIIATAVILLSILTYRLIHTIQENKIDDEYKKIKFYNWESVSSEIQSYITSFPGIVGLYIEDIETGMYMTYNAKRLFPSASVIKIPIMAAVFKYLKEKKIPETRKLTLKRHHKAPGAGKLKYCRTGSKFTIIELVERMITESDNTATNMLVEFLGFDYLNRSFAEFGLKSTNISRNVMDMKKLKLGIENYTTPEDIGYLLRQIYFKKVIDEYTSEKMLNILLRQKVNDRITRGVPAGCKVAHKTGLMRNVCHDAGIVFHPNGVFIICVFTENITNYSTAKNFIATVSSIISRYYATTNATSQHALQ